jgi:hypothetical protein
MNSLPKGELEDMQLLQDAWNVYEKYLVKSSNEYKKNGVQWFITQQQQFIENEEEFMNNLIKNKYELDKTYNLRTKDKVSYAGLQGRDTEKSYSRTKHNTDDENVKENAGNHTSDTCDDTAIDAAGSGGALAEPSTPKHINSGSNNGLLTPVNSTMKAVKRTFEDLEENVVDSAVEHAYPRKNHELISLKAKSSSKEINIVDELLKSVYSHKHSPCKFGTEIEEKPPLESSDDTLNFIETDHLKRVFVLDYNIGTFERKRSCLSRRTAFAMMEIAKISEEHEYDKKNSLSCQMIRVYKAYAGKKSHQDPNGYAREKIQSLYRFISRGKKVLRMARIVGGGDLLDYYIPVEFRWSSFYTLIQDNLNMFFELLQGHVNRKKKEKSESILVAEDTPTANENKSDECLGSNCLDNSLSVQPLDLEVFKFSNLDEIDVDSFHIEDDPEFDYNEDKGNKDNSICDLVDNIENPVDNVADSLEERNDVRIVFSGKPFTVSQVSLIDLKRKDGWLHCDIINSYLHQ